MTALKKFSFDQSASALVTTLAKKKNKNTHRSDRYKTNVNSYSAIGLPKGAEKSVYLLGHVFGKKVAELKYRVDFPAGMPPQITILNVVSDPIAALAAAENEVVELHQKSLLPDPAGFNSKNLEGLYLWGGVVGKGGRKNFGEAKALGFVNDDFIKTCEAISLTLRKFK